MNKEYFYPTINDLKNADCFDFDLYDWQYQEVSDNSWIPVKIKSAPAIIYEIITSGFKYRYSRKPKPEITHNFIMTSGEYWKCEGRWTAISGYVENNPYSYKLAGADNYNLEWFQTAKHCKCPPEVN